MPESRNLTGERTGPAVGGGSSPGGGGARTPSFGRPREIQFGTSSLDLLWRRDVAANKPGCRGVLHASPAVSCSSCYWLGCEDSFTPSGCLYILPPDPPQTSCRRHGGWRLVSSRGAYVRAFLGSGGYQPSVGLQHMVYRGKYRNVIDGAGE